MSRLIEGVALAMFWFVDDADMADGAVALDSRAVHA